MDLRLTPDQEFSVKMVVQLLPHHWDVLSPFEIQLCDEVVDRWLEGDAAMVITDAEWPALADAAQAMVNAKAGVTGRAA